MTKSKKTTIKKGSSKTEEIGSCLQKAETQLADRRINTT